MKIRCIETFKINIGEPTEKELFVSGEKYDYLNLSSGLNIRRIKPSEGPCHTFNEKKFYRHFTLDADSVNKCACGAEIPEDDPYDGYCTDCG